MNITGTAKTKTEAKDFPKVQEIAICPNCKFHFKLFQNAGFPLSVQKVNGASQKQTLQNYENVSLESSREKILDWKEFSGQKATEKQLIQALKGKEIPKIQKLKKLNDLNQLKKSRLLEESRLMESRIMEQISEMRLISPQKQFLSAKSVSSAKKEIIIIQQKSNQVQEVSQNYQKKPPKEVGFKDHPKLQKEVVSIHNQKNSEALVKECIKEGMIEQTLDFVLEWIQNFGLKNSLPGFLKEMVEDYSNNYQKNRELKVQFIMQPKK